MESGSADRFAAVDMSVLQLILQRACADAKPSDIVNMLLTSRTVYSTIFASCKGTVSVQHTSAATVWSAAAFASWLAKYGQLVKHLGFRTRLLGSSTSIADELEQSAIEQILAMPLKEAASKRNTPAAGATGNNLHLASCEFSRVGTGITAALQQLPCQSLTKLMLGIVQPGSSIDKSVDYISAFCTSLLHLTNLRSLNLNFESSYPYGACLDPMLHQLSALTNLTFMSLRKISNGAALQSLPQSVKILDIEWECSAMLPQHHLSHLTALTKLGAQLHLTRSCILPRSLVKLDVKDMTEVSRLMSLQNLQVLTLSHFHDADVNLEQLTSLTTLTHVKLYYYGLNERALSGAFWKDVPVKGLVILRRTDAGALQHLGQLTQLTYLNLQHGYISSSVALAAALHKLVSLQQLALGKPGDSMFWHLQNADGSSSAMNLLGALAGLRQLKQLNLVGLRIDNNAAMHMATNTAGQLTHLELCNCHLNDSSLSAIMQRSTQLVVLHVCENPELTERVLHIAAKLPRMRQMDHSITGTPT